MQIALNRLFYNYSQLTTTLHTRVADHLKRHNRCYQGIHITYIGRHSERYLSLAEAVFINLLATNAVPDVI